MQLGHYDIVKCIMLFVFDWLVSVQFEFEPVDGNYILDHQNRILSVKHIVHYMKAKRRQQ